MATWKKIIVSGSDAHLNQITSSIISSSNVIGTDIIADNYYLSSSSNRLASITGSQILLGDEDLTLQVSASSINISASSGITASIIPQTANPPFILAQTSDDKIVKIPLGEIGSSDSGNTVNNNVIDNFTTCSDNTNIGLTVTNTATSEVETLIGEIIINDVGTDSGNDIFVNPEGGNFDPVIRNQFIFRAGTGYSSGSINAGDTVRIKNNASSVINGQSDLNHTTKILSIFPNNSLAGGSTAFTSSIGANGLSQWSSTPNKLVGKTDIGYGDFFSASLQNSLTAGHVYLEGQTYNQDDKNISYRSGLTYFLYKVTAQSSSTVEICLDENLSVNDITQSGDLYFSASVSSSLNGIVTESIHSISYFGYEEGPGTGSLQITASSIVVSGNLDVINNVDIGGSLSFDGFTFSDGNILNTSGSTTFGSGSGDRHEFTGSLFVSGNITLDTGSGENTSKLFGTASHADFADSAGTANTASYIDSSNIDGQVGFPYSGSDFINHVSFSGAPAAVITGSLILTTGFSGSGHITASGAISASKGFVGGLTGTASFAGTSSFANSSSHASTASFVATASNALTASYIDADNIDGQVGFPFTGSAAISGSLSLDQSGSSSISLSGITGDISSSGNITASSLLLSNDLTIMGDLIVSGTQTTIHTEDLIIEDRFILIGSGTKATNNVDVGIIFDSGSIDGGGMGLFYDNSANRLAIGKNLTDAVISNTSSNYEVGALHPTDNPLSGLGTVGGNIMTIRSTGSVGLGQTHPIPTTEHVQFGKGEMLIDEDDNIWMYVGS